MLEQEFNYNLDKVLQFLTNTTVLTTLLSLLTAGIGYTVTRVRRINNDIHFNRNYNIELQQSQKRSWLRCEYLNIYNSPYMSIEEKYNFTRLVYRDYKNINGNHYIDELDQKLTKEYRKYMEEKNAKN